MQLRAVDLDPDLGEQQDRLHDRLTTGDTRWTLDLTDPYAWLDPPRGVSSPASALDPAAG